MCEEDGVFRIEVPPIYLYDLLSLWRMLPSWMDIGQTLGQPCVLRLSAPYIFRWSDQARSGSVRFRFRYSIETHVLYSEFTTYHLDLHFRTSFEFRPIANLLAPIFWLRIIYLIHFINTTIFVNLYFTTKCQNGIFQHPTIPPPLYPTSQLSSPPPPPKCGSCFFVKN